MRILALPAAVLLAFCAYPLLPRADEWLRCALRAFYARLLSRFSREGGSGEGKALAALLAPLCGGAALLSALHPLLSALVMAPLFTAASVLPGCARLKEELDSGAYARDIPQYEQKVRAACLSLADPFVRGLAAPLLLCAAGMPLYLGGALAWGYAALLALDLQAGWAMRLPARITRIAERVFCALLSLCAGVVGRSSTLPAGGDAQTRLIRTLGIAGDQSDTHAPVSGDIAQGVFLCCFCCALLLLLLSIALIPLC